MTPTLEVRVRELLSQIEADGLYKRERTISSAQAGRIRVVSQAAERELVNLCANNYLGLADHPEVIAAAKRGLDEFGFGMASVRFICGTQTLHRELERTIARYLCKDDAARTSRSSQLGSAFPARAMLLA